MQNILILGSCKLSTGQIGEFDYTVSQAIKAFKALGQRTILINPNVATVQTDKGMADEVYFVPLETTFISEIIFKEKIDAIALGFAGQSAINLGLELYKSGILTKYGVKVLGSSLSTIEEISNNITFHAKLKHSNINPAKNLLAEEDLTIWKEIEYEVLRDIHGDSLVVCNLENFDAVGIHSEESIVVVPAQTINDEDEQKLRGVAVQCADIFTVIGGCNIRLALNPINGDYRVIALNPYMSRSSVLAARATGYPLAYMIAKLSLGITLTEIIKNSSELKLHCVAVKIPRFDVHKLSQTDRVVGIDTKSVGEVMGVGETFIEALQKAVQMLNIGASDLYDYPWLINDSLQEIEFATDRRVFALFNWFLAEGDLDIAHSLSNIDKWFLNQIKNIAIFAKHLEQEDLTKEVLLKAKQLGFSDITIAKIKNMSESELRERRLNLSITPKVKCLNKFIDDQIESSNDVYMTYHALKHDIDSLVDSLCILGAGAYSIGSSVEFDWCTVNLAKNFRKRNKQVIIINSNPETVAADFSEVNRLYFEALSLERVQDILDFENPTGVCLNVSGNITNNLVLPLYEANYPILGTLPLNIGITDDCETFSQLLKAKGIDHPRWIKADSLSDIEQFISQVGFPVLIKPLRAFSSVAMKVCFDKHTLVKYLNEVFLISKDRIAVISEFIEDAKELEIDGVANHGKIIIHAISEHVENTGVHSGDATVIFPPERLYIKTMLKAKAIADEIVAGLEISGPFNLRLIARNNELKVLECNVRASRLFPFISKITGHDLISITADVLLNNPPKIRYDTLDIKWVGVKSPVFSYDRFKGVNPVAQLEMSSIGEVACIGQETLPTFYMSWLATGQKLNGKKILLSLDDRFKEKLLPILKKLANAGWSFVATEGTHDFLVAYGVQSRCVFKVSDQIEPNIQKAISNKEVDLIINLPRDSFVLSHNSDGFAIRRLAIDYNLPLITNFQLTEMLLESLFLYYDKSIETKPYSHYL